MEIEATPKVKDVDNNITEDESDDDHDEIVPRRILRPRTTRVRKTCSSCPHSTTH